MEQNLVESAAPPPSYKDTVQNVNNKQPVDEIVIDTQVPSDRAEVTHYDPVCSELRNRRRTRHEGWLSSLGVKILVALLCVIIVFVITFLMLVIKERDEARRFILNDK